MGRDRRSWLVTTDYVLAETHTLLRMRLGVEAVRRFLDLLARTRRTRLVWVVEEEYASALRTLLRHDDKRWSFTDCTSFAVMRESGIHDAFAFDRNFAQPGFYVHPQ
jgi:predicted nucleic acid-binding protein